MSTHPLNAWAFGLMLGLASPVVAWADSCHVATSALAFGAYDTASASAVDAIGTVDLHCSGKVHAELSLSLGQGAGASFSAGRKMTRVGGRATLSYNLYADAARTRVLGNGTHGSFKLKVDNTKNNYSQAIWGRLAGGQASALAGSYQDSVMVTISY